MTAEVWPVTDTFAAEIGDVDLSCPLSSDDWETIAQAYDAYSVLIFPDQHLSQGQHVAFAERFGPIDRSMVQQMDGVDRSRIPPEIADVSNLDPDGNVLAADDRLLAFQRANRLWHSDSSFKFVPANASVLYLRAIPPVGGMTEFADMRSAWDALADEVRDKIIGRVARHSIATSRARLGFDMSEAERAQYPAVPQALVRTHRTGRRSIYVASHAGSIVGMDQAEAEALIDYLIEHATQRQFVHSHRWRANDLVVWDNTATMHRGRPFDDVRWPRDAQRATSLDVGNTVIQEGLVMPAEFAPTPVPTG